MKKTLVIGASTNPDRYANMAVRLLRNNNYEVVALGLREGSIEDVIIQVGKPDLKNIETVTLYIAARHQAEWYDYILALLPKRIIFNPGTENDELAHLATQQGIEVIEGCTLVMLHTKQF